MGEKRGTKALETWCKRVTQGYPGVKVENMTTSWRDGMAFCAMIHHFRPDLIDFSSLDKSDILRNNEMAFRIAERHLGIPALLDAEDMAEYPVPDRLSILTYLSQFYQAFASNSASPIKKQSSESPDTSLTSLSPSKVQHTPKMEGAPPWKEPCVVCDHAVFIAQRLRIDGKLYHRTCFRCARCKTQLSPADYYETHDGQFCCETCPDEDKMETPIDPTVADDTRPPDDSPKSLVAMRKIMFDSYKDTDDAKLCDIVNLDVQNEISIDDSSSELNNSIVNNVVDKIKDPPECVEFTDTSRRNSLEKSNLDDNSVNLETTVHTVCDLKPIQAINPEIVINDTKMVETRPKSPIEATNPEIVISDTKMVETRPKSPIEATNPEIVINDTKMVETRPKNPFEDDDEEEDEKLETSKTSTNPFGSDSEDEAEIKSSTPNKTTPIKHVPSSNPFESDEDEESKPPKPLPRRSAQPSPQPFPRNKFRGSQMSLTSMSSMGSYTSPRKKKPAPPPPASPYNTLTTPRSRKAKKAPLPPSLTSSRLSLDSDVSTKTEDEGEPDKVLRGEEIALEISNIAEQISIMVDAHNESKIPQEPIDESIKSMETLEVSESVESNFELQKKTIPQTPPPKPRRLEVSSEISTRSESPTPSASTSNIDSLNYQDELTSPTEKETKDSANMNKKISEEKGSYTMPKSTYGQWRRKKAPAPPLPLPKRRNVRPMPIENIKQELYDIEIKQQGLERQGVTLENKIRDKFDTETSISPYVEELVLQLFELVNEKNELFRKQAELMYLRRQHHLEEEHAELEYQIRCLMARPENNKTDSDKETEEQLIQRLVEVVERRDAIVQCLEMDRLREAEEDKSINSSLDLSDSQPKSSKKHKKKKDKRNSLKSLDLDKDLDESEKEVKKKKKWYSTLQHLKNKRL